MADYLLFIHGVNVRENFTSYADDLYGKVSAKRPQNALTKIPLSWGNVNIPAENQLLSEWQNSLVWPEMWFKDFRQSQILRFVGDAALYISRAVGADAAIQMFNQAKAGLNNFQHTDRLHIVCHSWGTVILFDILFASRWTDPGVPPNAAAAVRQIRQFIQGVPDDAKSPIDPASNLRAGQSQGLRIASIHTMGSPLAIYQLMASSISSHDIAEGLRNTLAYYPKEEPVYWRNYLHPGDPVAYPLETVMPGVLKNNLSIQIADLALPITCIKDRLFNMIGNLTPLVLNGGNAHGSYWHSDFVADQIATKI